jgi:hypothetical protein
MLATLVREAGLGAGTAGGDGTGGGGGAGLLAALASGGGGGVVATLVEELVADGAAGSASALLPSQRVGWASTALCLAAPQPFPSRLLATPLPARQARAMQDTQRPDALLPLPPRARLAARHGQGRRHQLGAGCVRGDAGGGRGHLLHSERLDRVRNHAQVWPLRCVPGHSRGGPRLEPFALVPRSATQPRGSGRRWPSTGRAPQGACARGPTPVTCASMARASRTARHHFHRISRLARTALPRPRLGISSDKAHLRSAFPDCVLLEAAAVAPQVKRQDRFHQDCGLASCDFPDQVVAACCSRPAMQPLPRCAALLLPTSRRAATCHPFPQLVYHFVLLLLLLLVVVVVVVVDGHCSFIAHSFIAHSIRPAAARHTGRGRRGRRERRQRRGRGAAAALRALACRRGRPAGAVPRAVRGGDARGRRQGPRQGGARCRGAGGRRQRCAAPSRTVARACASGCHHKHVHKHMAARSCACLHVSPCASHVSACAPPRACPGGRLLGGVGAAAGSAAGAWCKQPTSRVRVVYRSSSRGLPPRPPATQAHVSLTAVRPRPLCRRRRYSHGVALALTALCPLLAPAHRSARTQRPGRLRTRPWQSARPAAAPPVDRGPPLPVPPLRLRPAARAARRRLLRTMIMIGPWGQVTRCCMGLQRQLR